MAHFYLDESLVEPEGPGAVVALRGADARHAVTVARLRAGERVAIGDGAGLVIEGEVVQSDRDEVLLRAESIRREPEPSPRLTLVQALAKGDRDELAVQAATELGVDGVQPWQSARSVSRWEGAKAEKGRARWQTIVREASKQAVRAHVPVVAPVTATASLTRRIEQGAPTTLALVLDPLGTTALSALDAAALGEPAGVTEILLVVGPEGGITPEEFAALERAGARRVRLGATVLRTSTAGPAAIAVLSAALGRW
ncbi:16S rRNA (uracil(1498)-N(3))-methyltransferase [Microcella daejeonensis]|uniref:16S rRNA (uracil(1498)-N(3))-methyltransferase n=1 Tax=Microcella daejeonensis TaxID=2994971 RepID=UPI0022715765|nr:16S rRNA (uracil(1498)-N(3))-methyltransferase [Microcella daejeonensis]WAB83237.1 16S rRNA (uracil(1498)-N(3))-methyltransferase [Microcella daejeonensis]